MICRPGSLCIALSLLSPVAAFGSLVNYPGFSNTAGLTTVGNTATATTSDGVVLRIVPAAGSQSGAAYSTSAIELGTQATFSTQFQFRITDAGGVGPADGFTFVLAASPTGLGIGGGHLGIDGVDNSLAIEFDTYPNMFPGYTDPNSNHVGVDTNGSIASLITASPYGATDCTFSSGYTQLGCLANGDLWTAQITYDGALLNVYAQDGSAASVHLISNFAIDLSQVLGTNTAYAGFTGGTGSGYENDDIVNWTFSSTQAVPPTSPVPEPGSLLLVGNGLIAGLALVGRRLRG